VTSLLDFQDYLRNYFIAKHPKQATQECCEKNRTGYSKMVQNYMPAQKYVVNTVCPAASAIRSREICRHQSRGDSKLLV
jgi:hypothetical protein